MSMTTYTDIISTSECTSFQVERKRPAPVGDVLLFALLDVELLDERRFAVVALEIEIAS